MPSPPQDQTELLKEVLEAIKTLKVDHVQLVSSVDAISGRVNVLAGMKEVRDIAGDSSSVPPKKDVEPPRRDQTPVQDEVVPASPSLPVTQLTGEGLPGPASHARKTSTGGTSRIILT